MGRELTDEPPGPSVPAPRLCGGAALHHNFCKDKGMGVLQALRPTCVCILDFILPLKAVTLIHYLKCHSGC